MKRSSFLLASLGLLAGCATHTADTGKPTLKVGITPTSQPMIHKEGRTVTGLEADFAHKLGSELGYEIKFVEIEWDKQIDALTAGKTDIIMSNMTITGPRSVRINFTESYMTSGLSAIFNRKSVVPNGMELSMIKNQPSPIGVKKGTTGHLFAMRRYPNAKIIAFTTSDEAASALKDQKIGMFIHDAPVVWWQASLNELELKAFPEILSQEPLAWGLRKSDLELKDKINAALAKWKQDGSLEAMLQNRIPQIR